MQSRLFPVFAAFLFTGLVACAPAGGSGGRGGGGDIASATADTGASSSADTATSADLGGPPSQADVGETPPPEPDVPEAPPQPDGLPILGWYTHSMAAVQVERLASASDGLSIPRDLAFDPENPGDLWIVNQGNESMVVVRDTLSATQKSQKYWSLGSAHFFAQPSSIAFGAPGSFATIHETDKLTQGPGGTPPDFMGPTLHSSDPATFDAGHGSHLDMMHNSPNGMGIAWEAANTYWVFDGYHSALARYAFNNDHGEGGTFHGDGEVRRYVEGEVKRVPGVPSHMEYVGASGLLYVADTGNNRIAVLDTASGTVAGQAYPNYDGGPQYKMQGATLTTLVDGQQHGLVSPSGLAIQSDQLFVSDNATGTIYAFTLEGELIDWLETGLPTGGLMGITFDKAGNLAFVDAIGDEVWYLLPLAPPAP